MTGNILKGTEFQPTLGQISLGEFFFNRAEKYGDQICQINGDSDESETYFSVKKRSVYMAVQLQQRKITSKDVIAFCSYNSLDNTIAVLSSSYLGAKIVTLDPTLSARTTKYLLSLVTPRIIFVEEESLELIENCLTGSKLNPEIIVFGKSVKHAIFSDLVRPCPNKDKFRPAKVDVHDTAIMLFSSGTTGLPKAICHSHQSFLRMIDTLNKCGYQLGTILHFTTFYWISGLMILTHTFMEGGTRVFTRVMDGENTLKMIAKYKLTALFAAPIYTYKLTNVQNPEDYDVSSFRCLLTGGTALSTHQYKQLCLLFPKGQIIFAYGMTEIGISVSFHPVIDKYFLTTKLGSCGKVCPGTNLKIVNPDTEETVGPNQKGEIRMKSDCLMQWYYQTDSSSYFDSDGFFKSGDIGYYDEDHCIYVVERMKEMFKYLSWHIVPSLIEAVLLEHPAVEEAVVFGIPKDEEGEIPAACVVLKDDFDVNKEDIEKFVEERVADREKLRGGVMFVRNLPKTPTGKLIRSKVRSFAIKSM